MEPSWLSINRLPSAKINGSDTIVPIDESDRLNYLDLSGHMNINKENESGSQTHPVNIANVVYR